MPSLTPPTLQVGLKMLAVLEHKFLLVRRSETVYKHIQGTMWDIPGGRIDPTRPLFQNLKRELREEVGLTLTRHAFDTASLLAAQDIWVKEKGLHVIRITYMGRVSGTVKISPEHEEYKLASYTQLLDLFPKNNLIGQVLRAHRARIAGILEK